MSEHFWNFLYSLDQETDWWEGGCVLSIQRPGKLRHMTNPSHSSTHKAFSYTALRIQCLIFPKLTKLSLSDHLSQRSHFVIESIFIKLPFISCFLSQSIRKFYNTSLQLGPVESSTWILRMVFPLLFLTLLMVSYCLSSSLFIPSAKMIFYDIHKKLSVLCSNACHSVWVSI